MADRIEEEGEEEWRCEEEEEERCDGCGKGEEGFSSMS